MGKAIPTERAGRAGSVLISREFCPRQFAADVFFGNARDAHAVFCEADHQFQTAALDLRVQMHADRMGKLMIALRVTVLVSSMSKG